MPKKRKKERYRLFREFIQVTMPEEKVDTVIARYKNDYINNMGLIASFVIPNFKEWFAQRTHKLLKERGKKGAKKRWTKP